MEARRAKAEEVNGCAVSILQSLQARSASTIRCLRAQPSGEQILHRFPVQVFEDRARLARDEGCSIVHHQFLAVAKHTECKAGRRFIEQGQVHGLAGGRLKAARQVAEFLRGEGMVQAAIAMSRSLPAWAVPRAWDPNTKA